MPKRKAETKLSGLVDGDAEDEILITGMEDETAPPPAKRPKGRPKATTSTATKAKASTTRKPRSKAVVGPKRQAAKSGAAGKGQKQGEEEAIEEEIREDGQSAHELSEDELDSPETAAVTGRQRQTRQAKGKEPARHTARDGEFEYTPTGSKKVTAEAKPKRGRKPAAAKRKQPAEGEDHTDGAPGDEPQQKLNWGMDLKENAWGASAVPSSSPSKRQTGDRASLAAQREGRTSSPVKGDNEVALRRKLGDMTKKYESMEKKYHDLREIGIVEANTNMEKLREQCESMAAASNALIASLKEELSMQKELAQKSRSLQKQLRQRDEEVSKLYLKADKMTADLSKGQNEVETLQMKLTAARNQAASLETAQARVPGSARKNGVASRSGPASAEASLAIQVAQLKEDLYSDLTGLIIRDVKKRESDHLFDCIQTGLNGTLHFKLAVADDVDSRTTTNLESSEFQYMPLLDSNRDRGLIDVLPEYLTVDITFSRQHAAKFYSRVVDTLTRKRIEDQ